MAVGEFPCDAGVALSEDAFCEFAAVVGASPCALGKGRKASGEVACADDVGVMELFSEGEGLIGKVFGAVLFVGALEGAIGCFEGVGKGELVGVFGAYGFEQVLGLEGHALEGIGESDFHRNKAASA